MTPDDRAKILIGCCLAGLAGFVDSLGYLTLKGFFVSFMSGNSTRLSIGLAGRDASQVVTAGALIGLFVLGVMAGTAVGHARGGRPWRILLGVAGLLALAALAASAGHERWSIGLAVLALGAENVVLQRAGDISISVTYMTGTLVKLGQSLASALLGGGRLDWLPYLLLWVSLIAGAVLGALAFPALRLQGLWIAAGWCLLLVPSLARNVPGRP